MIRKKALLIGDIDHAKYHPITKIMDIIPSIIPHWEVDISTNYHDFRIENLSKYDAFIVMIDQWKPLNDEQTFGIIHAIFHGKSMLCIHQGISLQARSELSLLLRARFTHHPEQTTLNYRHVDPLHPIMKDVPSFTLLEEPYMFILDSVEGVKPFLEYQYLDHYYPAGWAHHYGLGKVCYLAFGHHLEAFTQPSVQSIIKNSMDWLMSIDEEST
jgi:uncharacterized protein